VYALVAAGALGPKMKQQGQHYYVLETPSPGRKQRVRLRNTLPVRQFALACRCGQGHVRWCTLKHIQHENDLYCQYCEHDQPQWSGADKMPVPECEVAAMQVLKQHGLDTCTACQVTLRWWHGRVDFYHVPSKTAIQVDGSSHFKAMHLKLACTQLIRDAECCVKAWCGDARMLRMHYLTADYAREIAHAVQLPYGKFVLLSKAYNRVCVSQRKQDGKRMTYVEWLATQLPGARQKEHESTGCIIFW
jgi:hypothetical protein